jgi:hypothetical protein
VAERRVPVSPLRKGALLADERRQLHLLNRLWRAAIERQHRLCMRRHRLQRLDQLSNGHDGDSGSGIQ